MSRKHTHANMWKAQQPLTKPGRAGVRLHASYSHTGGDHSATNPKVATNIVEQRFGNRADKLLRRFSWEGDGE